jgi:2-phospho-L-lactate guanylyltransferase
MLLDVALAAAEAVGPANVFILYKPPGTPQLPEELGVRVIRDRTGTLNEALAAGQELVEREGFRSLLILHADLPLIEPRDVVRMFEATSKLRPPSALITPSKDGGTNALLLTPPRALEPRYGPGSFNRHLNQALEQGVRVRIYRSPPVETDIDSEKDLAALLRWPKVTHAKKLLLELSAKGRPGIERRVAF